MSATMAAPVNASPVSTTDRRPKRFDASISADLARIRAGGHPERNPDYARALAWGRRNIRLLLSSPA